MREEMRGGQIGWHSNPPRQNERNADYLFRVVKDVRNNLFRGGNCSGVPAPELARDRELIDGAIAILENAAVLHQGIKAMLKRTPGVITAEVRFEQQEAIVEYDPVRTSPVKIVEAIKNLGYKAKVKEEKET